MTIEDVANKLNKCALARCDDCEYFCNDLEGCQSDLIVDMGAELRKIAEQTSDDGK